MRTFGITLFGALEVTDPDGNRVAVTGTKQQALLAYLALNTDQPPTRDRLMSLLWGDRFTDQARQSLRQAISKLRKLLVLDGQPIIWTDNDRVGLERDMVTIDLAQFMLHARAQEPLADRQAISLFKSTLLEGLFVREAAFEDWLTAERTRINDMAFPVFERQVAHGLKSGDQAASIEDAQRLVALDPLRETSYRLLMRILAQSGQRAAAIQVYNNCADVLKRELGVEPDPETTRVIEEIKSPGAPPPPPQPVESEARPPTPDIAPASAASTKATITVTPFQTSGSHPDVADLSRTLTDDILVNLSRFRWLDVVALTLTSSEPDAAARRHAAAEQGIRYAVEGSIRCQGDQCRVTAQLVELETAKYVSVHRYEQDGPDLYAVIDEMSETIAATIESELVSFEGEKARNLSDKGLSAWDCYHLGLSTQYEFSAEGNARAQALFRRAIALDPSFAAAHARLAYAIVLSAIYFEADEVPGLLDEALRLARIATRLDDQDAVARFALGRTHLARAEYDRSIVELRQAIELNPGLAQAHCGLGDSLAYSGRTDEAVSAFEEAVRLSPLDPHRWAFSMYGAVAFIFSGEYERAAEWARAAVLVPNSHYWANAALVSALGHLGEMDEARTAVDELMALKPDFSCAFARQHLFYLKDPKQIDAYVEGLRKAGVPETSPA